MIVVIVIVVTVIVVIVVIVIVGIAAAQHHRSVCSFTAKLPSVVLIMDFAPAAQY